MLELDPIHMMTEMAAQNLGIEPHMAIGGFMHFFIGSVAWGGAFSVFNQYLPGKSQFSKGISLGSIAWLLMMIGLMPMSGAGFFGLNIGPMAPVMTLLLHVVFGIALGFSYKNAK